MGVDSSSSAIDLANQNSSLNNVESLVEFCREDATKFMQEALKAGKQWDIVILDPPKLAPSRALLKKAIRKYVALNAAAMKLVRPGGILMTCSCSGAMSSSGEFTRVIQVASQKAQVSATIILKRGAGLDHCLDPGYPEGEYLTNFTLRINER
jgi:23S rRNA G2069 N7-methylase RlmK/C1962 C5-methylase RlmI